MLSEPTQKRCRPDMILVVLLCLLFVEGSRAQVTPSYVSKSAAISSGSLHAQSTSYKVNATVGQPLAGISTSLNHKNRVGFQASVSIDQVADLSFTGTVTVNPSPVVRGNSVDIFFSIRNGGTVRVENEITAKVYRSLNLVLDQADVVLASSVVITSELSAGGVFNKSDGVEVLMPADTPEGSYFLILQLDPENVIKERNDGNNIATVGLVVVADTDQVPPVISSLTPPRFKNGATIDATITDNKGVKDVYFYHRSITAPKFDSLQLVSTSSNFSATIDERWGDALGMEYYFSAKDNAGNLTSSGRQYAYQDAQPSTVIPFASAFGGKTASYEMFSVPYNLTSKTITSVFDELSEGSYDKTKWRLFYYENGENKENAALTVVPGRGYWINMKEKIPVKIGEGVVVEANQAKSFPVTLAVGWNQIGNPYPFAIDWSAVTDNTMIGSLNFWSNGTYTERDLLKPWEGAFVLNRDTKPVVVDIPVSAKTSGRAKAALLPTLDLDRWKFSMKISAGDFSQWAGVGMHPAASESIDEFDRMTPPGFAEMIEMNVRHPEFFIPGFATDIMRSTGQHTWTFEVVNSDEERSVKLSWDRHAIADARASLFLIDMENSHWLNMKETDGYVMDRVVGKRQLKIAYNQRGEFYPDITMIGEAYPNPFYTEVTIPVLVEKAGATLRLQLFDWMGRPVNVLTRQFPTPGMHVFTWDGRDAQGDPVAAGVLLYRLSGGDSTHARKLIKSN